MPIPTTRLNDQQTASATTTTTNQFYEDYNRLSSLEICYHSQELIQELVQKCAAEFVISLRHLSRSVLIHDQHNYLLHKNKLDENLRSFETILTRLRVATGIINERKQLLERQSDDTNQSQIKSEEVKRLEKEVRLLNKLPLI
jgi:uncharacterized protein with von Willebrand factor type A (vWA) domain